MTTFREALLNYEGRLASLLGNAPDHYPEWGYSSYEGDKADIYEQWAIIRSKLKRDADKIELIEAKLKEAIEAFDAGDRDKGQWAIAAVYNLDVKKLR